MRIVLTFLLWISLQLTVSYASGAKAGRSYLCTFENSYERQEDGTLRRLERHLSYGQQFTVDSNGVRTGYFEGKYEVYRLGDAEGGWAWQGERTDTISELMMTLDPEGYREEQMALRFTMKRSLPDTLTIYEYEDSAKKPYVQASITGIETGRCVNF